MKIYINGWAILVAVRDCHLLFFACQDYCFWTESTGRNRKKLKAQLDHIVQITQLIHHDVNSLVKRRREKKRERGKKRDSKRYQQNYKGTRKRNDEIIMSQEPQGSQHVWSANVWQHRDMYKWLTSWIDNQRVVNIQTII